jgi:putative ABC transport system permease protein
MSVLKDVRIAFRLFRRSPALTGIALLTIALSVSATSVVFAALKSVLINPLPYVRPGELVQIRTEIANAEQSSGDWVFWDNTQEIIRRTSTLESVGIYRNAIFDLWGDSSSPSEALYGIRMSANTFPTLGVTPMLGRNILPDEDRPGQPDEMILSYRLWKRRFNADRSVVGGTVKVNGQDCTVIGVMPPDFNFPLRRTAAHTPSPYVEFWAPLRIDPNATTGALGAVARLRPGVSLMQAQQDLASISTALRREFPATNRNRTLRMGSLQDRTVRSSGAALLLLMSAALMFLMIGCANVANLLLARGLARQREIAVRMAVGASPTRIVRQLLTESCALAVLGGLCGYGLTAAAWLILPAIVPVSIPRLAAARADWTILGFTLVVALINGILFGSVAALRTTDWTLAIATRDFGVYGNASGRRMRASLVGTEVAIALSLVVIGAQLLGGFIRLLRTDPGFQADHILASVVIPARERYRTPEQHGALYRRILDAVRTLPGVESAGTVDALPFSGENHGGFIARSEAEVMEPGGQMVAEIDVIGGEYLQTMGVRLAEGRWFDEAEIKQSSDTAIVNDVAAKHLWPGVSAIGKQICVFCTPENPRNWKRIVGVVSSVRHAALDAPEQANVYLSARALERAQFLVVRTDRPSGDLEKGIRRAIAGIDPNQPVFLSASMRSLVSESLADRRFIVTLLSITACLALLMSTAGVYGVISYTTSRRTHEIGIRIALGATPGNVNALVFRQGFFTVLSGLAVGLGLAVALMRVLRGVLVGLESRNWSHICIASGLVSLSAAIACWVPARRAMKIDPMSALRAE